MRGLITLLLKEILAFVHYGSIVNSGPKKTLRKHAY